MAQKPVIRKSRKTIEGAKKTAAKDSVKKVEKAVGAGGSTLGNIDSLVNKHLAAFRNAERTLAQAKALVQTYGKKYPELALFTEPMGWLEEQFRATGHEEDARELSVYLFCAFQGMAAVAHAAPVCRALFRIPEARPP